MSYNTLFNNIDQKRRYYSTPDLYVNGFWISLLCTLGFKIVKPNQARLNQILNRYYMTMLYSQDQFSDDSLPDFIISIKVLRELNIINFAQTKSLFSFLDKNKKSVNQKDLRAVLKLLPFYKLRPNSFYSNDLNEFLNGKKDLEQITYKLFMYNSTVNMVSPFVNEYGILLRSELLKIGK